jgi:5-formyltetrahydrofolate cyclo-ligase
MEDAESVSTEKAAWRARFRARREAMPEKARAAASRRIVERVRSLPEVEAAETVHLFWPLPFEVDLRALAEALRRRGAVVALPLVAGDRALVHRRYLGVHALARGRWGLMQPPPTAPPVAPGAIDVVLVPALAVGRDGSRLGYGGGFYDTFLAETPALRVGVVFADALVDSVPTEPHDARLSVVVTEAETLRVSGGN